MITIDFKEFAWNLISELTDITYVEINKAFEEMPEFGDNGGHDEYIKWSLLKEQAHEAWCEVEDILEEKRIQREDLGVSYANCRCDLCVHYEEDY